MRISLKYLAPLAVLALVGCQTVPYQPYARLVKKKPAAGGVIAITMAHRDEDMPKATEMMAQNCGTNPSKVTEEGEVVVGTTTVSNAQETHNAGSEGHPAGTFLGMPVTSGAMAPTNNTQSTSQTNAVKEWQITYECQVPVVAAPVDAPIKGKKRAKN